MSNLKLSLFNYAIAVLIIASTASLVACKSSIGEDDDQVEYLIGVSQANLSEPWRVTMCEEIMEEAKKYKDLRVIFTNAAQNSKQQIEDVEKLIQLGVDLLIISPNESEALTPIVARVHRKIPVIVLDRAVEGYDYTLYIGPDNRMIGKQAGEFVIDLLGAKGGKIIEIQGLNGSPPVRDRSEGFRDVILRNQKIKIVDTLVADWLRDKAEDKLREIIVKHPDVDIIFAHNDAMALGAYRALKNFGLNHVKLVGIDGLPGSNNGLELVQKGMLDGTFTCPTGGREAIQYAIDILKHERGIPKKVILRSHKITRENIDEYLLSKNNPISHKDVKQNKIILGFAQVGTESEWRIANSNSIKSAAKKEGVELIFIDGQQSQQKQIEAIRSFIKQKVDVISFSPIVETGWNEVLQEAKAAGIPVIILDRTIKVSDDSLYVSLIGSDFEEEGRRAAKWLVEYMEKQGKKEEEINIVEIEGNEGSAPAIDRTKGFNEIIKKYPNFKVIMSEPGDFFRSQGKEVMKKFLEAEGENIDVVYAHNDDMAVGAIEAIEEYGLKPGKDIIIVSVDAARCAFKAMIEGKLNCTVECNPLLGPQLMKAVKDLMVGKQLPVRIITEEGVFPQEVARREFPNRQY
ncbi:MAG: Periplasmic binding protein domain containing protein [Clostridia bacterium]|jgi:simple sugar transport system substrate-binding protein|nr:Periplasmic binding protein domain containing protein [Clostridia bacterium]